MQIKKERRSFLKKRTKKLLFLGGDIQNSGLNNASGAKFKSFLPLFFKKEESFFLFRTSRSCAGDGQGFAHPSYGMPENGRMQLKTRKRKKKQKQGQSKD